MPFIQLRLGKLERDTSATWRSGYAAACKAVHTGSIPVVAFPDLQVDGLYEAELQHLIE